MTNPVNLDQANNTPVTSQATQEIFAGRTWCPILRGNPLLSEEQKNLVRSINLFGLSLFVAGSALLGVTIPLSDSGFNSELMDPDYRVISSLRFPCLILGASALYCAKITATYFKKTNESPTEVSPELRHEIEERVKENVYQLQGDGSLENGAPWINPQSVKINIPQTPQEGLTQQNGLWNRITTIQTSQKGLFISLGTYSICAASAAIIEFFKPDPPPDSLMPSFVDSTVVAKNTQKWSFLIISLATANATIFCAKYFLKNQQQVQRTITPRISSFIKSCVKQEIIKATPGPSGLQNMRI
ncbi:hypothetical protein [Candidatus Rhabdochlamydia sp. T3358]|uniref:hypothetical protein n=1 Tax=Candidatus Rhabdochlamydia sp. T3358 TaxID=2099795 RepID=UPI0010B0EFDF|nr:hypothetical protein [Candidatus Rhabdochlamydia sp. T3358]VHO05199.1 hypothetical protein RHT_01661 [Candidatus Rhabdochlamydia sp. T3358]